MKTLSYPIEVLVTWIFSLLLDIPSTYQFATRKILEWTKDCGVRNRIALNLQEKYAALTNGKVCGWCKLSIPHGNRHGICEIKIRISKMTDDEIIREWDALEGYDPNNWYDESAGLILEDWADELYYALIDRSVFWTHKKK